MNKNKHTIEYYEARKKDYEGFARLAQSDKSALYYKRCVDEINHFLTTEKLITIYEARKKEFESLARRAQSDTSIIYYETRLSEIKHVLMLLTDESALNEEYAEAINERA